MLGLAAFERFQDPLVEGQPSALQEGPMRYLVREGVLEAVSDLWDELRLVEEIRGLKVREMVLEFTFTVLSDGPEERKGRVLTDDGCRLEQTPFRRREAIDPLCQERLDRRRCMN